PVPAPTPVAPEAPSVTIDPIVPGDGDNTTLTGTVDNPEADVTVNVGGEDYPVTINPEPNEDGTYDWTVEVPTNQLPPAGEDVVVEGTVTDPETGLTSEPGTDSKPVPEAPNNAPQANADEVETLHGESVTTNVLENDTDADNDTLP